MQAPVDLHLKWVFRSHGRERHKTGISSEESPQSSSPSQTSWFGIQRPFLHLEWVSFSAAQSSYLSQLLWVANALKMVQQICGSSSQKSASLQSFRPSQNVEIGIHLPLDLHKYCSSWQINSSDPSWQSLLALFTKLIGTHRPVDLHLKEFGGQGKGQGSSGEKQWLALIEQSWTVEPSQ